MAKAHRRKGVASALIREVVSQHEVRGYLRITAAVASDLIASQAFYEKNGFGAVVERQGGSARHRKIVVRARDLDNDHLLSIIERSSQTHIEAVDLGLRIRGAGPAPLYAMDLNVLFDAIRTGRERAALAQRIVGAALAHRFRLVTAAEFVVELDRNTIVGQNDPTLALARQLPRLPDVDRAQADTLAAAIYRIVFGLEATPEAKRAQAKSDARHLAQAALARASGFITSDGRLLDARARLIEEIGIDLLSLDEFASMLDDLSGVQGPIAPLPAIDFVREQLSRAAAEEYFRHHGLDAKVLNEFSGPFEPELAIEGIREAGEIVGVAVRLRHLAVDAPVQLQVHIRSDHVRSDLLAEALLHSQCGQACANGSVTIELHGIPGQPATRRAALLQGFVPRVRGVMVKVAIGRPVTPLSWPAIARFTRRRTGLRLPDVPPTEDEVRTGISVNGPDGRGVIVTLPALEDALGPTLLAWSGRSGTIVPIGRHYADHLLGTALQFSMFSPQEAALVNRRTYVNTPRATSALRPSTPILFYESVRSGGRGAIVASARVVDAMVADKKRLPAEQMRRSVVDDVDILSSSDEVLVTTFDNLLHFPSTVSLTTLRSLGAVGPQNLVTATPVKSEVLAAILDLGWPNA